MSNSLLIKALKDREFTEEEATELVKNHKKEISFAFVSGANFDSIVSTLVVSFNNKN